MRADNACGTVPWFAGVTNRGGGVVGMRMGPCIGRGSPAALAVAALLLAGAALLLGTRGAPAQPSRVAEIATYQGADREQRLIEGAKKEKELTFYSSTPPEDVGLLAAAFDRDGVRLRGVQVLQRHRAFEVA